MNDSTRKKLQEGVLECVARGVARHGFSRDPRLQSFSKATVGGKWVLHLGFSPHRDDFDIMVNVAIRVDRIEEMTKTDSRLASVDEARNTATIGVELGNWVDGRNHIWSIASDQDIAPACKEMVGEVARFGLPYLERYSDLGAMLELLSRHDASAWIHSPIHTGRCKTIVSLALVRGEAERARALAAECERFLESVRDAGLFSFVQFRRKWDV